MKKNGRMHRSATGSPHNKIQEMQGSLFPELSEDREKGGNQKSADRGRQSAKPKRGEIKPKISDAALLSMLAKALVDASDRIQKTGSLPFPFPPSMALLWHYFAVENLWKQRGFPTTFQEMWLWAHRPLGELGLVLPVEADPAEPEMVLLSEVDPTETLLEGGLPTMLCHDLVMDEYDPEAKDSSQLIREVQEYCYGEKEAGQSAYVAFRRLLITHPVLTQKQWEDYSDNPDLGLMTAYIRRAYDDAPLSAAPDGFFEICPYCHDLCLPTVEAQCRVCSEPGCRRRNAARLPRQRPLRVKGKVSWLRPGLRRYVFAPGQAEIRLAETFQQMNIATELWPGLDAYDIRLCFPDGEVWAIDVKDWRSPSSLAKNLNQKRNLPRFPEWKQWFWVFPDYRGAENKNWLSVFSRKYKYFLPSVRAAFEKDVIEQARKKLREGREATAVGVTDRTGGKHA